MSDTWGLWGLDVREGRVDVPYIRNNGGVRQWAGPGDFGQQVEPWGRYMSDGTDTGQRPLNPGWERGTVAFENPMHIPHDYGEWKQTLSDAHGGLTGKELSQALLDKGHDGIITHDKYGIGEIVDLRPKDQRGHQVTHVAASGLQFRHSPGDSRYCPKVEAFKPGISWPVGSIAWQPGDGEVEWLDVHPDHQRQGIGTALFNHAQGIDSRLHHSDSLSADGQAFAESMGHDTSNATRKMSGVMPGPGELQMPLSELWGYRQGEVDPNDPYDAQKLQALHDGDIASGIHTPVTVAHDGRRAVITDGLHRAYAAGQLGMTHVPVNVQRAQFPLDGEGSEIGAGLRQHLGHRRTAAAPPGYQVFLHKTNGYGDGIAALHPAGQKPTGSNWHSAISWDNAGKITNLDTKPQHQGKGLARALYDHVRTTWRPDLMHDHALSEDGAGFAKAVGGQAWDSAEYDRRRQQNDQERKLPWQERRQLMDSRGWPQHSDL